MINEKIRKALNEMIRYYDFDIFLEIERKSNQIDLKTVLQETFNLSYKNTVCEKYALCVEIMTELIKYEEQLKREIKKMKNYIH